MELQKESFWDDNKVAINGRITASVRFRVALIKIDLRANELICMDSMTANFSKCYNASRATVDIDAPQRFLSNTV